MSDTGTLEEKRKDADELITEVLKKIPEESKTKVLWFLTGYVTKAEERQNGDLNIISGKQNSPS